MTGAKPARRGAQGDRGRHLLHGLERIGAGVGQMHAGRTDMLACRDGARQLTFFRAPIGGIEHL
jgi:hypothetical protein